jgi:hypothetical protein
VPSPFIGRRRDERDRRGRSRGARECSEQVAERAVAPGGGLAVEDREQRVGLLVKSEQFSRAGR